MHLFRSGNTGQVISWKLDMSFTLGQFHVFNNVWHQWTQCHKNSAIILNFICAFAVASKAECVSEWVSVCVCAPAAVAEATESEELTVNCSSLVLAESEDGVRKLRSSFSVTLELPHMEPVQTRRKRLYLAPSGCYSDSASSAVGVRTNLLVSVGFHFTG